MTLKIFCLSLLLVPLVFGLSLLPLLLQSPITFSVLTAGIILNRVVDPHWVNADPDHESWSRSQCGSGSSSRSSALMTKNWKIFTRTAGNLYIFFWSKIAIYLSLASLKDAQATGIAFSPQKWTSSTSLFLWLIFALLDPATQVNADPCGSGSGSTTVIFRGIFCGFLDVLYSTLFRLPPLRFHCAGSMLGLNLGLLRLWHWLSEALTTRQQFCSSCK